ncbi:MAG: cytochrome c biogenesis protein CcsA [Ignavibacteriales bacterium]|nr:cytochrome c biogenesis protein CcsA [Ignavibacteriales bacterium]
MRLAIILIILNIVLPLVYFALVWTYGKAFFSDEVWARKLKSKLLLGALLLHCTYLILRTIAFSHPPVTSIGEILSVLAFSVALAYASIEARSRAKETGYFILNFTFFFQLGSTLFIRDLVDVPQIFRSGWFGLHVTSAMIGYSAITISAVYGFLYLMLYHEIKANRFGVIYKKLPNLETLERMNFIAISLAFAFLTMTIVAGFIWLPQAFTGFSYADPKLLGTIVIWLMYGAGILAKTSGRLRGRSLMVLSIGGFTIALFSMSIINMFFSSFHRFN